VVLVRVPWERAMPAISRPVPGRIVKIAGMARSHGNIASKQHQIQKNNVTGIYS